MKKSIIAMSMVASLCFANSGNMNDLELLGQSVLKNSAEIKQLKIELEEIKTKLNLAENNKLKVGDAIGNDISNATTTKKVVKAEPMLFKANKATYVRNSPSSYSAIIEKVEQGQVLKKVVFESKYKMDSWIFVGNGFILKSLFTPLGEAENEK